MNEKIKEIQTHLAAIKATLEGINGDPPIKQIEATVDQLINRVESLGSGGRGGPC